MHDTRQRRGLPLEPASARVGRPSGYGRWGILESDHTGDTILCHECGRWLRSFTSHLSRTHNLTAKEYRQLHGLATNVPLAAPAVVATHRILAQQKMQTPQWTNFTAQRDRAQPSAVAAAKSANCTLSDGARASHERNGAALPRRTSPAPTCNDCGKEIPRQPNGRLSRAKRCATHQRVTHTTPPTP